MDAAFAADAVDRHDMWMFQAGRGAGLVLKTVQVARVHGRRERQNF
jgi:hypothetical protein